MWNRERGGGRDEVKLKRVNQRGRGSHKCSVGRRKKISSRRLFQTFYDLKLDF
jgi:hypothetical protein